MAFQSSLTQLPQISVIGSDLLPSVSHALSAPLRAFRRSRRASAFTVSRDAGAQDPPRQIHSRAGNVSSQITLPECLSATPMTTSQFSYYAPKRFNPTSVWTPSLNQTSLGSTAKNLSDTLRRSFHAGTSSSAGRLTTSIIPRRTYATSWQALFGSPGCGHGRASIQKRGFASSFQPSSMNLLAHTERTANNNPTSPTAQAAFYSALMRANMPKIVIERYQTGRYAANAVADASYLKALQLTGSVPAPGAATPVIIGASNLSPETLQAVGQTAAAHTYGAQVSAVTGKSTGTGAKDAPLHVVVEESFGMKVFRWVKMILYVGLFGYFMLVCLTMVVELTGSLRTRVGQNNEVQPQHQTVRFSDVHGCDEAKEELQELVEFLINPERFSSLGGKLPKGVLLVGPPGTGKTMLARAVAGEAGCPVFYMSGSEFDELYVGVGAKRVRDLFQQARNKAPSIIFIDELDAVGGKRNARDPAYAKQTLNQLLTELDGFSPSTGVILIAATNYPESLDKALTRPGRFDRHVTVNLPDVRGRIEILKHHMRNIPISADVDATNLARATSGFSGADLENLCNQAAVRASRQKLKRVTALDFEWAKDKIMMGAEAKSRMIREKDKIMTAYHEAGHALVNLFTPSSNQLYKMTIIPRGRALGVTHSLPEMDAVSMGYDQYLAQIDVSMGGRAAEELVYGPNKVSSGISSDVSAATQTAYDLVTRFGYSPKLGNIDLASNYRDLSAGMKMQIEEEVRDIVEAGRQRADTILREKRKELELLKEALLEYETLTRDEMLKVMKGEKLQRLAPEYQDDNKPDNDGKGGRGAPPKREEKPKQVGPSGGVGIKLPDVLQLPGTGSRSPGAGQ